MIQVEAKDIMDLPDNFAEGCDLVYTDPPWEPRMLKWFETLMRKNGYTAPSNDIDAIITRLFQLAPRDIPIFIAYAIEGYERVISIAQGDGRKFIRSIQGIQTTKNPLLILQFDSDMPKPRHIPKRFETLQMAIDWHCPKKIFDPFAGMGRLIQVMKKNGCDVIANEINPERARKIKLI
tara:strand:- start:4555 stop:5091 length:537 start_codon:yes stop_codon:yes gene_type:complete